MLTQRGTPIHRECPLMDNSIYVMLSRQTALFRDMEVTAGNIANANTVGFGGSHLLFNSYLGKDVNQGQQNPMQFAHDISTYRNLQQGSMKQTGNQLDVAINGSGYFMVNTPLGVRYTRAGNFQVGTDGFLTTADGNQVLDNSSQPIQIPEDANVIEIGSAGNISINGEEFGNLGVAQFENEQLLQKVQGALYRSEVEPTITDQANVQQGVLENANVQAVNELTHMMQVSRSVANTAKFIEVAYDLQRKASTTIAQQG